MKINGRDRHDVHKLSGIVHGKETTDSLFCGRVLSTNMRPVDFPWSEREAHEFCEQCNRALHRAIAILICFKGSTPASS